MDGGTNVSTGPFQAVLPAGWYRTRFEARLPGGDDIEEMELLVMVYEDERDGFEELITHLLAKVPEPLRDASATLESQRDVVGAWREKLFDGASRSVSDLDTEIFQVARHIADHGAAPPFFAFEVRASHDLDAIAARHIQRDMGPRAVDEELRREFARDDRFWRTLFNRYEQFRHSYDGCVARLLAGPVRPDPPRPPIEKAPVPSEPPQAVKDEVLRRDDHACLASLRIVCPGQEDLVTS